MQVFEHGMATVAVGVSLYWLSWFIIGVATLTLLTGRLHVRLRLPRPLWLLGAFMIGCFVYLIVSIVLYAVQASASMAAGVYVLLMVSSVSYLCVQMRGIKLSKLLPSSKLVWIALVIVVFDFCAALFIGSALQDGGDSYVHIGRIHDISVSGYNILTPYSQFAVDANYHYNLVYSLYQPLLSLSDISALDAWRFSSAFFRAVNWLCIYATTLVILSYGGVVRKGRSILPAIVTILALIAFGHIFMYSAYPGQVAVVWLYTLVLSAVYVVRNSRLGAIGMILSSLLLTFTHPSYALMGGVLMTACLALTLILRANIGRLNLIAYLVSLVFLAIGPLIAYILSGPLTSAQADIAQSVYQNIGPVTLRRFDLLIPDSFGAAIFRVAAVIGTGILLAASWKKNRLLFCVVAPVLLLWAVIMYLPGIVNLLMIKLPPWLIARFDAVNVFQYVTPFVALWWLLERLKARRALTIGFACVVGVCFVNLLDHQSIYKDMRAVNIQNYAATKALSALLPDDKAGRLDILAEPDVGYQTMAVRRVNLLDAGEGHTVPRANPVVRRACSEDALVKRGVAIVLGANYVLWRTDTASEILQLGNISMMREAGGFGLGTVTGQAKISELTPSCALIKNQVFTK